MQTERISETKTIMITGATSGIGLAAAKHLHECGYLPVLIGRDEERTALLSSQLHDAPYVIADLEKTESIHEIMDSCQVRKIRLDGLVHAAGAVINVPARSFRTEDMERQIRLHYYAFLELCKGFYSRKISNDGASIVAISSLASMTKLKGSLLYAGSKGALNTAISVLSKEFSKRMIRVNGLLPAYVSTRMTSGLEELIDVREKQPFGMIPPENIAELIEMLLSDKTKYITGALIPVSAGMEF